MDDDLKIILVVIGLYIVQTLLAVGPLRTQLETTLILSLVPGLDLIIAIGNLVSTTEVGSVLYYIQFMIILVKDTLIAILIARLKKLFKK